MQNKLLLFLIILFPFTLAFGQTGKIAGTVISSGAGDPMPGVNVIVQGTDLGAATDEDGEFVIVNVPAGTYRVSANFIGYSTLTKTDVTVRTDQTASLTFEMQEEAIAGEEVIVEAEAPAVELDLTGSKESVSSEDLSISWAETVDEAITTAQGVGVHGGIRGDFNFSSKFVVDGVDVQESMASSNYLTANSTAIQSIEVQTGGFNAEHASARGSIVNLNTKMSTTNWHGSFKARTRPPGQYHWGRNMYSRDNFEWQVVSREWFENNPPGDAWMNYWTNTLGEEPSAEFMWEKYQEYMTPPAEMGDYTNRFSTEFEGTVYGPITKNLSVMLSGSYFMNASRYPSYYSYDPNWNLQSKIYYNITPSTKLEFLGMHRGTDSSSEFLTNFTSSLVGGSSYHFVNVTPASVQQPYNLGKFYSNRPCLCVHGTVAGSGSHAPPAKIRSFLGRLKLTHSFSSKSYMDFTVMVDTLGNQMNWFQDRLRDELYWLPEDDIKLREDPMYAPPAYFDSPPHSIGPARYDASNGFMYGYTKRTKVAANFASQVSDNHFLKLGAEYTKSWFNYQYFVWNRMRYDAVPLDHNPYEGAAYIQDRIETKGMNVNIGLRFDFFNGNEMVNYTIFDPFAVHPMTQGNEGDRLISFDKNSEFAVPTPTRTALSPRIGISHPITENTVLHFMYGHFAQRPPWMSIVQQPMFRHDAPTDSQNVAWRGLDDVRGDSNEQFPDDMQWFYPGYAGGNPAMDYAKMIQWEVGFEQDIADLLRLDVTMYYKDGQGLANVGIRQGNILTSVSNASTYGNTIGVDPDVELGGSEPGAGAGGFNIRANNGRLDVRGVEATIESRWSRYFSIRLMADYSVTRSGVYGPSYIERNLYPVDLGGETQYRLEMRDQDIGFHGSGTNTNEVWNPGTTLKLNATLQSPEDFGPSFLGMHPLQNWTLNIYSWWTSPQKFTYYSLEDLEEGVVQEPDNKTWEAKHLTNLKLIKHLPMGRFNVEVYARVLNLFNFKHLRLMGGDQLRDYMEEGKLPIISSSYTTVDGGSETWIEPNQWTNYSQDIMPREVWFGLQFSF
jgi:hypothetical protein